MMCSEMIAQFDAHSPYHTFATTLSEHLPEDIPVCDHPSHIVALIHKSFHPSVRNDPKSFGSMIPVPFIEDLYRNERRAQNAANRLPQYESMDPIVKAKIAALYNRILYTIRAEIADITAQDHREQSEQNLSHALIHNIGSFAASASDDVHDHASTYIWAQHAQLIDYIHQLEASHRAWRGVKYAYESYADMLKHPHLYQGHPGSRHALNKLEHNTRTLIQKEDSK